MLKKLSVLTCMCFIGFYAQSMERRDILQKEADAVGLEDELVQSFPELHFPGYGDRAFWDSLPGTLRSQYIDRAEAYLQYPWPSLKATDFLEIIRSGDRRGDAFKMPLRVLRTLMMGELVAGDGRFLDQIVNGVWYFCEQTWWGRSAHLKMQAAPHGLPDVDDPVIDLGVGDVAHTLSWAWQLFKPQFDAIHPLIAKRIRREVMAKVLIPYYEREDMWWMGFDGSRAKLNNWTPHITYSMLTAMLILDSDRTRVLSGVRKALRSMDIFLNGYPDDGGCDEGPSYWGKSAGGLYMNLELLRKATGGAFDVFDHPLIGNIGRYIYRAYIDYPYFVNFSDADAVMSGRPFAVYCYGRDIGDAVMQKFGAYLAEQQDWGQRPPGGKIDEQILQLMHLDEVHETPAENALIGEFWLPQSEFCGARDRAGSTKGFYFAAKGSHNGESHNHNDVGTCVLYYNGKPCLIDLGRQTYTARTFGPERYEIWTMQSQYHNVPVINGKGQGAGMQYGARNARFESDNRSVSFSADLSPAYPADAMVRQWNRTYRLNRGEDFRIHDDFDLLRETSAPTSINFMTCCEISERDPGRLILNGDGFRLMLNYNPRKVRPVVELIDIEDENLARDWPGGVARIVFRWLGGRSGQNEIVLKADQ